MAGLKLGQILVSKQLITPEQLAAALGEQQHSGARLGTQLVRMGALDEETLIRTLAGQLKLPVARIRGKRVNDDVLELVPKHLAEKHRCLPLFLKQEGKVRVLFVAMEDPSDGDALDDLGRVTGETLRPVLVGPTELEDALGQHYADVSDRAPTPAREDAAAEEGEKTGDDASQLPDPGEDIDVDLEAAIFASAGAREAAPEPAAEQDPLGLDLGQGGLELLPGVGADEASADEAGSTKPDIEDVTPLPEWPDEEPGLDDAPVSSLRDEPAARAVPSAGANGVRQAPASEGSAPAGSMEPGVILRALSQLLVEKGVISREEFIERLGEIAAEESTTA
jgi:hypothetical protein